MDHVACWLTPHASIDQSRVPDAAEHRRHPTLESLRHALARDLRGRPVTVVAPAPTLTFDALDDLGRTSVEAGCSIAYLPLETMHRPIRWPRPPETGGRTYVLDAVHGDSYCSEPGAAGGPAAEVVSEPWSLLGLFAHGDGSHLDLSPVALCGLVGQEEHMAGVPIPGGCMYSPPFCKKTREMPAVAFARDLRCELLVLFSCTSLSLARQVFPSDISLALAAFAGGGCGAVIGCSRQVRLSAAVIWQLLAALGSEPSMADALLVLNRRRAIASEGVFAMLGEATAPVPQLAPIEGTPRPAAAGSRVHAVGGSPEPATAAMDLDAWLLDLEYAERIERALRLLLVQRFASEANAVDRLAELIKLRTLCQDRAWAASAGLRRSVRPTPELSSRLLRTADAWCTTMIRFVRSGTLEESHPGGGVGDIIAPALSMFCAADTPEPTRETCPHCRGVVSSTRLTDRLMPQYARWSSTCAACGFLASTTRSRFRLLHQAGNRPGELATFRLEIGEPPARLPGTRLRGVLQLRDKTRRRAFPLVDFAVEEPCTTLRFALPADAGVDLWSARAVVAGPLTVDYARCVFFVSTVPMP